jgi:hypothetical protein
VFDVYASATYQSVHDALERIQRRGRRALLLRLSHMNNCLARRVIPSYNPVEFEGGTVWLSVWEFGAVSEG